MEEEVGGILTDLKSSGCKAFQKKYDADCIYLFVEFIYHPSYSQVY